MELLQSRVTVNYGKPENREDRDFIEKVHRYASVRNKNVDFLVNKINRYSGSLRIDDV